MQRNGDPDFIYRKVYDAVGDDVRLFLNNEEPRTKSFDEKGTRSLPTVWERHSESFTKGDTYPTMACPKCRHKIVFDYYNNDGVGRFHCENCGHGSGEKADYTVTDADFSARTFKLGVCPSTCLTIRRTCVITMREPWPQRDRLAGFLLRKRLKPSVSSKNVGGRFGNSSVQGKDHQIYANQTGKIRKRCKPASM